MGLPKLFGDVLVVVFVPFLTFQSERSRLYSVALVHIPFVTILAVIPRGLHEF